MVAQYKKGIASFRNISGLIHFSSRKDTQDDVEDRLSSTYLTFVNALDLLNNSK